MSLQLRPIIKLSSNYINSLHPGHLIEGNTINAFLRLIERRSLYYNILPTVFAFDTEFLIDLQYGRQSEVSDIFSYDILLLPIRLPYWALIVVELRSMKIKVFDSLKSSWIREQECVLAFICSEAKKHGDPYMSNPSHWELLSDPKCPSRDEKDAKSCGLFVCYFAEKASRKKDVEERVDLNSIRKIVQSAFRRGKFYQEYSGSIDSLSCNEDLDGKQEYRKSIQNVEYPKLKSSISRYQLKSDSISKEMSKHKEDSFLEVLMDFTEKEDGNKSSSRSSSPCLSTCAAEELIDYVLNE